MLTTTGKSNYVVQQVHLQLKYSQPLQNIALAFQSNIKGRYKATVVGNSFRTNWRCSVKKAY